MTPDVKRVSSFIFLTRCSFDPEIITHPFAVGLLWIDEGKRTRLTIEVDADPKGALPPFVVNFFQKDWSRDTIKGIRKQTKKADLKVPDGFAEFLDPIDF